MSHMVDLVIFGGTGDLSTRKLLPALFLLHRHQLADRLHRIIATGRGEMNTDGFREEARENLQRFLPEDRWDESVWATFRDRLFYQQLDAAMEAHYQALGGLLDEGEAPGRLYYLATLPSLYGAICHHLQGGSRAGQFKESCGTGKTPGPRPGFLPGDQ
jgi:glucose-6-phosphate 1-dehydrogenase